MFVSVNKITHHPPLEPRPVHSFIYKTCRWCLLTGFEGSTTCSLHVSFLSAFPKTRYPGKTRQFGQRTDKNIWCNSSVNYCWVFGLIDSFGCIGREIETDDNYIQRPNVTMQWIIWHLEDTRSAIVKDIQKMVIIMSIYMTVLAREFKYNRHKR